MELKVKKISKKYGNKEVLKNINFTMREGTYGFLGENGAGKSTLMRIITTVDFATKGEITFNGEEIIKLDEKYRDIIGYMPQDYNIYSSFTAYEFLEYMGALKGIERKKLKEKIPKILEFVNLGHVANKKVSTFSGGMKRRIGIAQAIINDPKILILDEPTVGLDPKERIRFSNIISAMAKDKIVILSTHIVSDIEAIANEVIVIKNGDVLAFENIDILVEKIKDKVFEGIVTQSELEEISEKTQIIRRKQDGEKIRVRYVGDIPLFGHKNVLEATLEDYYMYVCI